VKREVGPILDLVEAANWTATVNLVLRSAMSPAEVAALPDEALWVLGAILERACG